MSEGLFSASALPSNARAGYRLHHVELFNWGTFDGRVWRFTPGGETSLLTGDIGSGKSTLVDAVTTLLMPSHRIAYNKAAGADAKERTLRSYVEGHYKSERVEATGTSRAVGLRDHHSFSVVLAVFGNEGYDETVTLAQVFHQRDRAGQPERFFVTSTKGLSIETDFTAFGADLNALRRRLRAGGSEVDAGFPDYARRVRTLLGIRSEQALELFHQTVSMKSVGNLNDFVRHHMLEPVDASDRVRAILGHFDDLTKAHDAVARAREQLTVLAPLVAAVGRYDAALSRRSAVEAERRAVRLFFAERRIALLDHEILVIESTRLARQVEADEVRHQMQEAAHTRDALIVERAAAGGDRVQTLEREAQTARAEAESRRMRRADLDAAVAGADLEPVEDRAGFGTLAAGAEQAQAAAHATRLETEVELESLVERRATLRHEGESTRGELLSLQQRTSNLPRDQVDLRRQLCEETHLDPEDLPFAGELLDVAADHVEWRGAAERVLRGFALSLLVPQRHYAAVAGWVNGDRLTTTRADGRRVGGRLVYERVPERRVPLQPRNPARLVLAHTLVVADGPLHDYVRSELVHRADHRCVTTMAEFRDEHRAVTREGQVRSGDRHEKDDRSRVDDPRRWVLGWSNQRKIDALLEQLQHLQITLTDVDDQLRLTKDQRDALGRRLEALGRIAVFRDWSELDWADAVARADAADAERAALLAGESRLGAIQRRLDDNDALLGRARSHHEQLLGDVRVQEERVERARASRRDAELIVVGPDASTLAAARDVYPALAERLGDRAPRTSGDCGPAETDLAEAVQAEIDRAQREMNGYGTNVVNLMNELRRRWPGETTDMDAHLDARAEYVAFHGRVATDDLPRFEGEFRTQLTTNTIRELAAFANWLRRQSDEIHDRVARINDSLGAIDYSAGRYIALVAERTVNQEVAEFRSDLRHATDDALGTDDDHYTEQRFLDVQRILQRFRGRDGHAESDKIWTRRVTDVRNWFTFSASERDRETDDEWEHYRDSDGKSGGQKEKLAYTILAASLAYQFGLEWGVERSRDFRFAVIDEAFGRGSNTSTTYALELFAKLGLQLLIVTPLQKVHVIEPFVRAIGFVDNPTSSYSRLHTLTIEEFRDRQADPSP